MIPLGKSSTMVLVKEVAKRKREQECRAIRERLDDKTRKLSDLYNSTDAIRTLQALETTMNHLLGERPPPRPADRRGAKREYYQNNKDAILSQQRKKRQELRAIAEEENRRLKESRDAAEPPRPWDAFQAKMDRLPKGACVH